MESEEFDTQVLSSFICCPALQIAQARVVTAGSSGVNWAQPVGSPVWGAHVPSAFRSKPSLQRTQGVD